jgi:hypothetical protein
VVQLLIHRLCFSHHMPTDDLLHMLPSNSSMNQARDALQEQLSRQMEELEEVIDWAGNGAINDGKSS